MSDRALEAARICEDYCRDIEGAVSILMLARCWRRAQQIAARVHRADLLDEVSCHLSCASKVVNHSFLLVSLKILSAARDAYAELRQSLTSHR